MPSSEPVPDVRAGEQLDHNAFISVGVVGGGVELVFGRLVRWGAGVEAEAGEEQLSLIVHRESIEQRILGNVAGVGLGEGEGAVGGDVDLLATGHFDVLWKKLAKEYKGDDDPERESKRHTRLQRPSAQVQTVSDTEGGQPDTVEGQ